MSTLSCPQDICIKDIRLYFNFHICFYIQNIYNSNNIIFISPHVPYLSAHFPGNTVNSQLASLLMVSQNGLGYSKLCSVILFDECASNQAFTRGGHKTITWGHTHTSGWCFVRKIELKFGRLFRLPLFILVELSNFDPKTKKTTGSARDLAKPLNDPRFTLRV